MICSAPNKDINQPSQLVTGSCHGLPEINSKIQFSNTQRRNMCGKGIRMSSRLLCSVQRPRNEPAVTIHIQIRLRACPQRRINHPQTDYCDSPRTSKWYRKHATRRDSSTGWDALWREGVKFIFTPSRSCVGWLNCTILTRSSTPCP